MEFLLQMFRKPAKKKPDFAALVLAKLNQLIKQGDRIMTELDELKAAVAEIAADNLGLADEVKVAMDRISQLADAGKMDQVKAFVKEATESLRASHAGLSATLHGLKAKVDEVSASNGDAG
jgi:multidrug resistance efflux pump